MEKALDKIGYIDKHQHDESHKSADERAVLFLQMRQPGTNIHARITKQVADLLVHTSKGILLIIDVFLGLGQRGIAFRGNFTGIKNKSPRMELCLLCALEVKIPPRS